MDTIMTANRKRKVFNSPGCNLSLIFNIYVYFAIRLLLSDDRIDMNCSNAIK